MLVCNPGQCKPTKFLLVLLLALSLRVFRVIWSDEFFFRYFKTFQYIKVEVVIDVYAVYKIMLPLPHFPIRYPPS